MKDKGFTEGGVIPMSDGDTVRVLVSPGVAYVAVEALEKYGDELLRAISGGGVIIKTIDSMEEK